MQEAPPPGPSRRTVGNKLDCSFRGSPPCKVGAVSCKLVKSTAADRAAATCLLRGLARSLRGRRLLCKKPLPRAPSRRTAKFQLRPFSLRISLSEAEAIYFKRLENGETRAEIFLSHTSLDFVISEVVSLEHGSNELEVVP